MTPPAAAPRTMAIPDHRAPENLIEARRKRLGDAYPCIVCGLPTANPKFFCHVIDGGSRVLHPEDEALYVSDGGDMHYLPLGAECRRNHPDLKAFSVKAEKAAG